MKKRIVLMSQAKQRANTWKMKEIGLEKPPIINFDDIKIELWN